MSDLTPGHRTVAEGTPSISFFGDCVDQFNGLIHVCCNLDFNDKPAVHVLCTDMKASGNLQNNWKWQLILVGWLAGLVWSHSLENCLVSSHWLRLN